MDLLSHIVIMKRTSRSWKGLLLTFVTSLGNFFSAYGIVSMKLISIKLTVVSGAQNRDKLIMLLHYLA